MNYCDHRLNIKGEFKIKDEKVQKPTKVGFTGQKASQNVKMESLIKSEREFIGMKRISEFIIPKS